MGELLPQNWLAFAVASVIIELTPGPNMSYIALVSLAQGRRAGFATVAGVALGLALIGAAGAAGAAALIESSPTLHDALRWAGFAFMLYLAYDGWRAAPPDADEPQTPDSRHFLRGFVTNVLNPKAAVFYVTVLPTFVTETDRVVGHTVALTVIYVAVATAIHAALVLAAGTLRPMITNPRRETVVRRALSLMLAGVAVWFFWATGR